MSGCWARMADTHPGCGAEALAARLGRDTAHQIHQPGTEGQGMRKPPKRSHLHACQAAWSACATHTHIDTVKGWAQPGAYRA